ncbi:MAG: Gfo/Idh/MocA family oxidoreductase, partial [Chloroflexi bacterium]|nr:Gfo/Idh/MocA family oxidoreductase [Chloroflexota bacterium]
MDEIRIAVVGLGTRARHGWIPLLQRIKGYRITAICDPVVALHAPALAQIKDPQGVKTYSHYADVLADPNVDAIALTVRCQEQGAMAAQALEAGKHINAEVPAAHSMADCWRIVVAQERSGKVYQLAEQVRYAGYVEGWTQLVGEGQLGHITYCEGQYLHYYVEKSFQDPQTGEFYLPHELAAHPEAQPTWLYHMPPIHYIVHDLSPMLKVLDDRVVEVVAMSTASPSYAHPELSSPDVQVSLLKTAKGTLMRMLCSFAQPHPGHDLHWLQVIGTRGSMEWKRAGQDKPKLWLDHLQMHDKTDVDWRYERTDAPPEARGSGHSDMDYYVHAAFRDAVLGIRPLAFDVYKAMDIAAPAILAA